MSAAKKSSEDNEAEQVKKINQVTDEQVKNNKAYDDSQKLVDQTNQDSQNSLKSLNDQLQTALNQMKNLGGKISSTDKLITPGYGLIDTTNSSTLSSSTETNVAKNKAAVQDAQKFLNDEIASLTKTENQVSADKKQLQDENNSLNQLRDQLNAEKKTAGNDGLVFNNTAATNTTDYNTASSDLTNQINQIKTADANYQKNLAAYKDAYAKYQKEKAAESGKGGSIPVDIAQSFLIKAEDNSVLNTDQALKDDSVPGWLPSTNSNGTKAQWKYIDLKSGQSVTATYTNLTNSTYNHKTIQKIVRTFTALGDERVFLPSDPSLGAAYDGTSTSAVTTGADISEQIFGDNGQPVTIGDDAYIATSSLNNLGNQHIEEFKVQNGTPIEITGSTIKTHDDGYAYADSDNEGDGTWDNPKSPNRYLGAIIYKLNSGTSTINYSEKTINNGSKYQPITWATADTSNLPVLTEPVAPDNSVDTHDVSYNRTVNVPDTSAETQNVEAVPSASRIANLKASYSEQEVFTTASDHGSTPSANNSNGTPSNSAPTSNNKVVDELVQPLPHTAKFFEKNPVATLPFVFTGLMGVAYFLTKKNK